MSLKDLGLQDLQIDFASNSGYLSPLYAKEGDIGTRGIRLQVLDNGVAFDLTGVTGTLYAQPQGAQNPFKKDFTLVEASEGKMEVVYTTDMLVPGIVYVVIELKESNGNILSYKKLKLQVEGGLVTDSAIEGSDSYPIFEQLLEAGANEIARKDAEVIRQQNEDTRIANETQRQQYYTQRIGGELGEELIIRSLPNGTKDEVREGKLIKRVSSDKILNGVNLIASQYTHGTNTYAFISHDTTGYFPDATGANNLVGYCDDGVFNGLSSFLTDSRGIFLSTSNYRLYTHIEKTKIDAMTGSTLIDKARSYFNQYPVTLNYQLAEPILIPLPEQMTPNTIEIARLSELTNKLTNAIISLGGTIV